MAQHSTFPQFAQVITQLYADWLNDIEGQEQRTKISQLNTEVVALLGLALGIAHQAGDRESQAGCNYDPMDVVPPIFDLEKSPNFYAVQSAIDSIYKCIHLAVTQRDS